MREILFRGKAINRGKGYHRTTYKNGDWVYGLIERLYDDDFPNIPATMRNTDGVSDIDIDYATIGQYTGLTDKNGKMIFEGDIVGHYSNYRKKYDIGTVKYGDFNCSCCQGVYGWFFENEDIREHSSCDVLGNIYDNPELLILMVIGALGSLIVEIANKGDLATALQWIGACLLYTALTFRNIR